MPDVIISCIHRLRQILNILFFQVAHDRILPQLTEVQILVKTATNKQNNITLKMQKTHEVLFRKRSTIKLTQTAATCENSFTVR